MRQYRWLGFIFLMVTAPTFAQGKPSSCSVEKSEMTVASSAGAPVNQAADLGLTHEWNSLKQQTTSNSLRPLVSPKDYRTSRFGPSIIPNGFGPSIIPTG